MNGDAMINRTQIEHPTVTVPTALPPETAEQPKGPGKFSKIFGGLLGGALNIIAPGAGTLVGGFINRGGSVDYTNMQAMLHHNFKS
jgi:hypothetical protein